MYVSVYITKIPYNLQANPYVLILKEGHSQIRKSTCTYIIYILLLLLFLFQKSLCQATMAIMQTHIYIYKYMYMYIWSM